MRPTRLAWLLLLIGAALAALPAWVAPSFAAAWLGYVMGVLALGALDGALATRLGALAPRIVLAPALPVGVPAVLAVDVGAPANLTGKAFSDRPYRAELLARLEAEYRP